MSAKDILIEHLGVALRDVIVMHNLESLVTDKMRKETSKRIYDSGGVVNYLEDLLAEIDNLPDTLYDDSAMKAAFHDDFTQDYLEHIEETIDGRDIAGLLYMAFCRGYVNDIS